ncbi:hypothetical protein HN748_05100, partial [Candidatus Peregrinibacteria bacterium]|nr:hypothetical protein [Candidatus Peregrinibacteria bacterium]
IILVSHAMPNIEEFCDKVIYLKEGCAKMIGLTGRVIQAYKTDNLEKAEDGLEKENEDFIKHEETDKRWGSQEMVIDDCELVNSDNKPIYVFTDKDDQIRIRIKHVCHKDIDNPSFGIKLYNETDLQQFATTTFAKEVKTANYSSGDQVIVEYVIPNVFSSGEYHLTGTVGSRDGKLFYDWREKFITFSIKKEKEIYGSLDLPHTISIS